MAVSIMAGIPALKELNADLRRRMDQAVADFQGHLASTRTGRASVHMLDQVKVDYYGTHTPISQLAQISTPEAQLIVIAPWDPTVLKEIEKALSTADLTAMEFVEHTRQSAAWTRLMRRDVVRRVDLEGADHTLSRRTWQLAFETALVDWLGEAAPSAWRRMAASPLGDRT